MSFRCAVFCSLCFCWWGVVLYPPQYLQLQRLVVLTSEARAFNIKL